MSLPSATVRPCNECPWRRNSAPGWLGPYDAQKWLDIAHGEAPIACHQTICEDESWEGGVLQCKGAAIFRHNLFKLPRNPEVAIGPSDVVTVFRTNQEFLAHHERR